MLAVAVDVALLSVSRPPSVATTTTSTPSRPISPDDHDEFCSLASEYLVARRSARLPGNRRSDWETQLGFLSLAASMVSSDAVDPVSGETWRSILLDLSDRQALMNLELVEVDWDLGAYHDATSSGVVKAPPPRLFAECTAVLWGDTASNTAWEFDEAGTQAS